MKHLFLCLLFAFVAFSAAADDPKPVKYVFLFIGDGMSIPQREMTEEFLKKTENRGLIINDLQCQGLTHTRSANSFITDSAASGTAIACGEKTNNGMLGVTPDKKRLESVAEAAQKSGRKVGIVTSVTLNHATPAAFYAHNASRGNYYAIGLDLIASGFDYFGGGGLDKADDKKAKEYKGNLYDLAREAGYTVSLNVKEFKALKPGPGKVISTATPTWSIPYAIDASPGTLLLADFTRQAIEHLDNPKGFFLMVEGGKIDWMCHANDAATTLREVIDFDNAVKVAYEFVKAHPDEAILVVTGDHETGGLTLGFAGTGYTSYIELLGAQKCSRDAFGRQLRTVDKTQVVPFEQAKPIITRNFGLLFTEEGKERVKGGLNLTEKEEQEIEETYRKNYPGGKYAADNKFAAVLIRLLNNKAGVAWTSGAHTALPVETTSYGAQAELFSRRHDNTDIAKRLKLLVH